MLTYGENMDEDLVNGSRGIVLDFLDISEAQRRGLNIAQTTGRSKPQQTLRPTDEIRPLSNHIFARDNPWPLVRFESGRELLCSPLQFTCEGPIGNTEASRTQVPLILAWALSIHKSQGQTLERVKVDIGRAFEKGQGDDLYVLGANVV
jgi:ATP-dependent DNA helicase PIF1